MELIDKIQSTKVYAKFDEMCSKVNKETLEKYEKDCKKIQVLRMRFYKNDKIMLESMTDDMAYRSRCIFIQISCKQLARSLEDAISVFRDYSNVYFKDKVKTTIAEKNSLINLSTNKQQNLLNYIYSIEQQADLIINDIDQASWARKNLVTLLELKTRPEFNAV